MSPPPGAAGAFSFSGWPAITTSVVRNRPAKHRRAVWQSAGLSRLDVPTPARRTRSAPESQCLFRRAPGVVGGGAFRHVTPVLLRGGMVVAALGGGSVSPPTCPRSRLAPRRPRAPPQTSLAPAPLT